MDRYRLDRIAKSLAAVGTRRSFLRGIAFAAAGAGIAARVPANPALALDPGPAPVGTPCFDPNVPYGAYQCIDECLDGAAMDAGACTVCSQLTPDVALCVGMPGYPCVNQTDCNGALGHFCDSVTGLCEAAINGICTVDSWCAVGSCVDVAGAPCIATVDAGCTCQCSPLLGSCDADTDCCEGMICSGGTCLIPDGGRCPSPESCSSGVCGDVNAPWEQCYLDPASEWYTAAQECYCGVTATATITAHYRCCPEGAVDVFEECHHNPIADLEVAISTGEWGYTDADGNYVFYVPGPGPWLLSDVLGAEPVGVYCAMEDAAGADAFINDGLNVTLPGPESSVICDIYYTGVCTIDDGKKGDDGNHDKGDGKGKGKGKGKDEGKGGVELPETGVGEDLTLGAAIVGVTAVAVGANILGRKIGETSRNE